MMNLKTIGRVFRSGVLTCILICTTLLFNTTIYAQVSSREISINANNFSLNKVIKLIEQQTDMLFIVNNEVDVNQKLSVELKKTPLTNALTAILQPLNIQFGIQGKHIILSNNQLNVSETNKTKTNLFNGTVLDSNNNPIIGATIIIKETNIGATTDVNGNFQLNTEKNTVLIVSYLGFKTEELNVAGKTSMTIELKEDSKSLDEIVVVGYGNMKRRDITSSISKVSSQDMKNNSSSSLMNAIQGKTTGVLISSTSGRPGTPMRIRIRGIGTINNNDPLYVLDGMPVTNIDHINSFDIESIEILKDASAAAIYGTRAANGVVMVTTKFGSGGDREPIISIDASFGIANPSNQLELADADEYLYMMESVYGDKHLLYKKVQEQHAKGYNTNWWDETNRFHAPVQNYSVSLDGGSNNLSYYMTASYLDQQGIDRKSNYNKLTVRINSEYKARSWLTIGESIAFISENTKGGGDSGKNGFVVNSIKPDPLFNVMDSDKNDPNQFNNYGISALSTVRNPVAVQDRYIETRNGEHRNVLLGNVYAQFNYKKLITFRSTLGFEISNTDMESFSPAYYLTVDDHNATANNWKYFAKYQGINWLNTLNFQKDIKEHTIQIMAGAQIESNVGENLSGLKFGQPNNEPSFQWINAGVGGDEVSGVGYHNTLASFFGRVNYNYADKYLISASVRSDGSSNFSSGHRWGVFPAVSAAWRISSESFFKDQNIDWISQLKIRAGWGQLGNQRIPNTARNTAIGGGNDKIFIFNGEAPLAGYGPINAGNPFVSWEKSESINLGVDLDMFDNNFNVSAEYFIKNTTGMLIQIPISEIFGTFSPWENLGKVQNKGFEFQASYKNNYENFNYGVGANISFYKNNVISLGGSMPYVDSAGGEFNVTGYSRTEENMPIGYFYGYVTDGIFQSPDEVNSYVNKDGELLQAKAQYGDMRFVDINGDGEIDDKDKTMIGSPHPDFIFGGNIFMEYKGIDLNLDFTGTYGNDIFNAFKEYSHRSLGYQNIGKGNAYNAWTGGSNVNDIPRLTHNDVNDNYRASDFYIEDGSFFRLKNLQIGYSFSSKVMRKMKLKRLRLYISVSNLFTITKYSGMDPEIGSGFDRANGVDIGNYPQVRTIQIGTNIQF